MSFDLIIKNSMVVMPDCAEVCDVAIAGGKIAALAAGLADSQSGTAEVIDASGLIAMPGGVDSHVHISQPSGPNIEMADDFLTGTRAAACGGNTTIMPFVLPEAGQTLREAVTAYHAKAENACFTDVSFHLIVKDADPVTLGQDLPALIAQGHTSVKVFMTYQGLMLSDGDILSVMDVTKDHGALVMIHAENEAAIEYLRCKAERAGDISPVFHAYTRPIPAEREATHRATSLAQVADVPIMIVHVSNGETLDEIRRARARGVQVLCETCPQYITLVADDLVQTGFEGAKFVCSPPPRDIDSQVAIWSGLLAGEFDVFSSDHCPFRYADAHGKDAPGARASFRNIPNGIPGVETRLPILFSEGVSKGRISLNDFANLTATRHAQLYGLSDKGALKVGADADIVLWDPDTTRTIRQSDLHHGSDYSPWEGFDVTGWPVRTILRGVTTMHAGDPVGNPIGRHVARATPEVCS